jgi:hypothetical protein
MGCVLGSMGFDITMEYFVYRHLRELYRKIAHMALIDDLMRLIKTPGLDASVQKWEEWYDKIAEIDAEYDRLSEPIGIIRAPTKSELLVPNGAPMPINCTRANGITLNVSSEGTIIGGSPIGTDIFIKNHVSDKVDKAEEVMTIIKDFGATEPQMAHRLLEGSVNKGLDYILITTPERPIQDEIDRFDQGINTTFLQNSMLSPDGTEPDTSQDRLARACALAQLPHRNGGGNLTAAAVKSAPAFIANIYRSSHYMYMYVRGRLALEKKYRRRGDNTALDMAIYRRPWRYIKRCDRRQSEKYRRPRRYFSLSLPYIAAFIAAKSDVDRHRKRHISPQKATHIATQSDTYRHRKRYISPQKAIHIAMESDTYRHRKRHGSLQKATQIAMKATQISRHGKHKYRRESEKYRHESEKYRHESEKYRHESDINLINRIFVHITEKLTWIYGQCHQQFVYGF